MNKRGVVIRQVIINISLAILSFIIFFGSLEIYARYRYFGGTLKEKGFYSRERKASPKRQTPIRIVCIGGSTTHGSGDIEYYEAYPFYLEQMINKRLGRTFVEVMNSGLAATPTEHHRNFIRERIDDQELDIIVLHSLYNHFSPLYPILYDGKINEIVIETNRVRTIYNWERMTLAEIINVFLMEHSYFYTRLREKILTVRKKDIDEYYAGRSKFVDKKAEVTTYEVDSERDRDKVLTFFLNRYYKAIEDIILTAKSRNVEVVLVIPPYPFFIEERKGEIVNIRPRQFYNTVFEKARQCLVRLGGAHDLLVIDADDEFMRRGRSADLFSSSIHLTPKGNRMIADIMVSKIIAHFGYSQS